MPGSSRINVKLTIEATNADGTPHSRIHEETSVPDSRSLLGLQKNVIGGVIAFGEQALAPAPEAAQAPEA